MRPPPRQSVLLERKLHWPLRLPEEFLELCWALPRERSLILHSFRRRVRIDASRHSYERVIRSATLSMNGRHDSQAASSALQCSTNVQLQA